MGTHSDGNVEQELLTTFVTCEGDLSDPQFNTKFARLLKQLQKLLLKDPRQYLGVVKVEPWNSVRVTFTVPKEAALRLRQLAQQGDATLSQLGILSVQLEGDQAISLRIAGRVSGESQEIVLRTTPADNDVIGNQTSTSETDHLISKSVVVSASGGTASFIRTMTQVLSGTTVNQSLTAFKSPNVISPVNTSSSFSISPKVSSTAVISTTTKISVPHSYHSPFVSPNSSSAVLPVQNRDSPANSDINNSNNHRFSLPPPPPYPNIKTSTSHLIKLNRNVSDDLSSNPSRANVALSSPLLISLLQNDGGVPLSNCKTTASDKQKLKSTNVKNVVPTNTVKRKDSTSETFNNVNQLQQANSSSFVSSNSESQVIQRVHRTTTVTEPLTMVTNVRIPVESCNTESVIVSSGKLPAVNQLTAATANVKQNYSSQNPLVNIFQRQIVTSASNAVTNQQKSTISSPTQFLNRVTSGSGDNQQILTVGQAQKLGVRVINVQSPQQQQLLQSQQLTSKQLIQQQFPTQQQHLLIQQQQPPSVQQQQQQQKSVILPQSTHSAKINVSTFQELNKFTINQSSSPVAPSIMVSSNRLVNQFSLNSLPQQVSTVLPNSNESKFDNLTEKTTSTTAAFANMQSTTTSIASDSTDKTSYLPVSSIVMTDGNSCQITKSDSASSVQNGNRISLDTIVTGAAVHLVKSFTFAHSNLSQSNNFSVAGGSMQETKINTKLNPVSSQDKLNISQQAIISSINNSAFNLSSSTYHNTGITSSNTVSNDKYYEQETFGKGKQSNDFNTVIFTKSDTNTISNPSNVFQTNVTKSVPITTVSYVATFSGLTSTINSSVNGNNQLSLMNTRSTIQLPQYSQNTYNVFSDPKIENILTDVKITDDINSQSQFSTEKEPQFLINPLTGEMEAMPNESSDNESDNQTDIFNSLPPSVTNNDDSCFSFSPPNANEKSNSVYSDEDDDDRSNSSSLKKSELEHNSDAVKPFNGDSSFARHRIFAAGSSPNSSSCSSGGEKIKIRLKLEKSEPMCSAYVLNSGLKKVDKPTSIVKPMPRVSTSNILSIPTTQNTIISSGVDEPRVPPIRLSLRGKNLAFVKKNKKWSEDSKESVTDDSTDKKGYFNKRISPCDVISEKESLTSDSLDLCKSPVKLNKSLDGVEDMEELKSKLSRSKKMTDNDDVCVTSQLETSNETISTYNPVLPSVRTFPTEAEVTSILRSVPTDAHNKMSLSSMKIKKKEGKKRMFSRERPLILSSSVLSDDTTDTFTRVINETKCTLSSQSRGKSKSNASSLLKSVMKSSAAKEARLMNLANRNLEKRTSGPVSNSVPNESPPIVPRGNSGSISMHQRRSSAEITYATSSGSFSNVKLNQRSTETLITSTPQYTSSTHSVNNAYGTVNTKEMKKFMSNSMTKKIANNCKTRDYQNSKNEIRKEFHLNHENKKSGAHFSKKIEVETGKQNIVVNCLQVESNPAISNITTLSTTHLDVSEKIIKQRLTEDNTFGESIRKKQRIDNVEGNSKNGPVIDRLMSLPNKESDVSVGSTGGESPSGHTTEQTNNQGEDSGIESMDALSEKSPNQGESPCRKEEKDSSMMDSTGNHRDTKYCDKPNTNNFPENFSNTNLMQCERERSEEKSKINEESNISVSNLCDVNNSSETSNSLESYTEENINQDKSDVKMYERTETMSPELDEVQPFRVTPALYTYSNPEKIRNDSPSPVLEDITDEISISQPIIIEQSKTITTRLKRKRKESNDPLYITNEKNKNSLAMNRYNNKTNVGLGGKSLLEQLLIDIPSDNNMEIRRSGMSTRNTRSQVKGLNQPSPDTLSVCSTSSSSSIKTPKCSPIPRSDDVTCKQSPRPSSRLTPRRSRKGSESSNISNSDESSSFGRMNKRKTSENVELSKACIGFEDQNGKKVAISAPTSVDCYHPIINENSIITAQSVVISSNKIDGNRQISGATSKNININSSDNVSQSRHPGKRKKGINSDTIGNRKSLFNKSQPSDSSLIQITGNELQQEQESDQLLRSVTSTSHRGNSRLSTNIAEEHGKQISIPSTSRRSIRQNHITRRRKSPVASDSVNSTLVNTSNNNNNSTNKNNNSSKIGINYNETTKTVFHEKNGVSLGADKTEGKSVSKLNYVTKNELTLNTSSVSNICNSIIDSKSNGGNNLGSGGTVTTRGTSVKQTHLLNDSSIITPPQDVTHTHTIPVSEEVINTRRKTRSVAHSNDSEHGNKRRRNSKDGK